MNDGYKSFSHCLRDRVLLQSLLKLAKPCCIVKFWRTQNMNIMNATTSVHPITMLSPPFCTDWSRQHAVQSCSGGFWKAIKKKQSFPVHASDELFENYSTTWVWIRFALNYFLHSLLDAFTKSNKEYSIRCSKISNVRTPLPNML